MAVERRYSVRMEVEFDVDIRYRDHRAFPACAANLSAEGIYLRTRRMRIPTGTLVQLEFRTLQREWTIDALVVHTNGRGLGVMFREALPELVATCQRESASEPVKSFSEPLVSGL